jgi:hypothetical protein
MVWLFRPPLRLILNHVRFYKQDERAGQLVAQTLSSLPPYHQAPFARVQSSIREAYHRSVAARRHAELQAHLSFIQPGASLSAHLRPNPRSKDAQKGKRSLFYS